MSRDDPAPVESVTGFRPADEASEPATAVTDAVREFTAALVSETGREVGDPRDGLTEDERRAQHSELLGFVWCQREGEELSGVVPRK